MHRDFRANELLKMEISSHDQALGEACADEELSAYQRLPQGLVCRTACRVAALIRGSDMVKRP